MKKYKIYGEAYPVQASSSKPADAFAYGGELVDEVPKGKVLGYVEMEDGSIIEVHNKTNLKPLLIIIILAVLIAIGALVYLLFFQDKDVKLAGTIIKQGVDNDVVHYDGFMTLNDNGLRVSFDNGDLPAQIIVQGDGVKSQQISVEPGTFIDYIPCEFTTEEGVVEATLTIMTATSKQTFNVVVEIPANNNANDTNEGFTGLFDGEAIYGLPESE